MQITVPKGVSLDTVPAGFVALWHDGTMARWHDGTMARTDTRIVTAVAIL